MSILSNTRETPPSVSKDATPYAAADISQEFKKFVADVERLVKETANLSGDELAHTKIKLNQRINAAKQYISTTSNTLVEQTQKAATATNELVHEKPWAAIGTGAVVSFVLGLLLRQRSDEPSNKDPRHK